MTDRGLLDTSVFIASESGRPLDTARLPDESAISVVTLAELHAGVLAAGDTATRAIRMATLDALGDIEILPIDAPAALVWAQLRVYSPRLAGGSTSTMRGSPPPPPAAGCRSSPKTTTSQSSKAWPGSWSCGCDGVGGAPTLGQNAVETR